MKIIKLRDYVAKKGQSNIANKLGVTQGAISKALKSNRNIIIKINLNGDCIAEEIRPFPSINQ